ncbi:hypothetical protein LZ24_02508 [Desulfobotulus alkaliphilus]|uniref:Uncharacterized protein n=1 Tax=Desulfobotulus alkaliphilus TaxID=622671 RepID=A0A562RJI5_9BACT|nr:hypothetical protein [Desulfobotulus alkaliphilus]TWI68536.1 hypothetical protein LZ24_02508 [Desulfobotulus alkaliphilus]
MEMACERCKYEVAVCELLESVRLNGKDFSHELRRVIVDLLDENRAGDCSDCDFFFQLLNTPRHQFAMYVQDKRKKSIAEELIKAHKPPSGFRINEISLIDTCYFDQNIFDQCRRSSKIYSDIKRHFNSKIVYSLVHIDEIIKCNSASIQSEYFEVISEITNNQILTVINDSYPRFGYGKIDPAKCIPQVLAYKKLTALEEQMRLVDFGDRFVFFEKYKEGIKIEEISDEEFNNIFMKLYGFNNGKSLLLDNVQKNNYITLRVAFYAFFMTLDCLRFKSDKEVGAVISGTYDWEHILYASNSKYFITEDKRLRERAKIIYKKFGYPTEVLSLDELIG